MVDLVAILDETCSDRSRYGGDGWALGVSCGVRKRSLPAARDLLLSYSDLP